MEESPAKRPRLDAEADGSTPSPPSSEVVDSSIGDIATGTNVEKKIHELPHGCNQDKRLCETDVGITEYISKHVGFSAILKQRYSDFIVREIAEDGRVIQLTNFDLPEEISESLDLTQDTSCLSSDDLERLQDLADSKDKTQSVVIKVGDDKEERTRIHKAIRSRFPGLESQTAEEGLQKVIKVTLQIKAGGNRSRWPQSRGDYCKFVLYKENKDTMDALNLISKHLRVKPSLFSYAGTKDRRAKTSQEVTAFRVSAEALKGLNKTLRNMALGNFSYCRKPLRLGQLNGNCFTVILREVTGEDCEIDAALKSLADVGFINYYGMQRFGTTSIPTHHIGRALLSSQWQKAVELILHPRNEDDEEMAECRRLWWETRDAQRALTLVGKQNCIEQSLLQGLVRNGQNNYCAALTAISRNTRTMYIHSYQSFVWNSLVSRRIKILGLQPVVGDLVLDTNTKGDGERVSVIPLTADTVKDYRIEDIVLPLPGFDVIFPQNEVAEWYTDMLKQDGLEMSHFKHKNRDYSLAGAYRKLIVKPADVTWSCHRYDDPTIPLALSDLEMLEGVSCQKSTTEGKLKALELKMSLPPSCYATMAVRDILKMDTSSAYQSTLNPR